MAKHPATFALCPGIVTDGRMAHTMRDNCWSCAPFWEVIPLCPVDERKLTDTGYCRTCRKHFDITVRPDTGALMEAK